MFSFSDGGAKYRNGNGNGHHYQGNGIVNANFQTSLDHLSTLSRPRSAEAVHSNGSLANGGRQLNGMFSRSSNGLHEDLEFPPTPRTLSRKKNIVWMRPHVSFAPANFFIKRFYYYFAFLLPTNG